VIKILIADDHSVVRRGLMQILLEGFPGAVFGEAASAHEILEKIREQNWSLLTLDIGMPDRSGVDLLRELRVSNPRLPILVLSMYAENDYARRVLKAGAAGYLSKDAAPVDLTNAARKILRGGRYVSPALAEQLAADLSHEQKHHEDLSDRELEVLRMMASGKTVTQIADALGRSPKTISTHRARILRKMDMTTTAELVRYAMENHLFL
jgi:two-component system invasion response regulator UvrY